MTVVSAMAAHLPTGRGSPVSIHGLPALREIETSLRSRGFDWMLLEEFKSDPPDNPIVALWDFGSVARLPTSLDQAARGRAVAWSLESPLVAHRGYHYLPAIANKVAHIVGYPGVGNLVDRGSASFHPTAWPNALPERSSEAPWSKRQLLVMINSNKALHQWRHGLMQRPPRRTLRLMASSLVASSYRRRRQWTVPDLYHKRLETILHFAGHPGFRLYGVGWAEPPPGRSAGVQERILGCYGGEVADKNSVLSRFRFALCIENTVFPGYISEKLFDAMAAGTIPIYLGAPDVSDYVPEDCYIDMRRFSNHEQLAGFIEEMSPQDAEPYHVAARRFTESPMYRSLFSSDQFVSKMVNAVVDTAESAIA